MKDEEGRRKEEEGRDYKHMLGTYGRVAIVSSHSE